MKLQKILWPSIALLLAISLGLFIGNQKQEENWKKVIVKTYKVPANRVGEAKGALSRLFSSSKFASAQALGNGLLLVRMPVSYEPGVQEMINQFQKATDYNSHKVKMDYWVLRGSSVELKEKSNLKGLEDVIESIEEADGKQSFQLLEHLSSNSSMGRGVRVKGWLADIESNIAPTNEEDQFSLWLNFETKFGKIVTNTKVRDGEYVVLGQSAANKHKLMHFTSNKLGQPKQEIAGENKIYFILKGSKVL